MLLLKKNRERQSVFFLGLAIGIVASLISVLFCDSASARPVIWPSDAYKKSEGSNRSPEAVQSFRSPEEAVKALVEALSANDEKKLLAIFGPGGKQLISS